VTEIRKAGAARTLAVDGDVDAPYEVEPADGPIAPLLDRATPAPGADHVTVHSGDGLFRASIPLVDVRRGAIVGGRVQIPEAPTNCWNVKDVARLEVTTGPRPDSIAEKEASRAAKAAAAAAGAADEPGAPA
jgi:hypothetical protein